MSRWFDVSGCRMVIGKGGMSEEDYRNHFVPKGAVYLTTVGYGTGALLGRGIKRVAAAHWLKELGLAQAIWVLEVERFGPFLVESDMAGNSLFERENAAIAPGLAQHYTGTKPATLRRFGETDDKKDGDAKDEEKKDAEPKDAAAGQKPDPGRPPIHRLNRLEYTNAIRDLLALDVDVSAMLPRDDLSYGFDNVTVREICKASNANVAAINYHFGDKAGLYRAVVNFAIQLMQETNEQSQRAGDGRSPEDQIRGFVRVFVQRVTGQGPTAWIHKLMAREMEKPTEALDQVMLQVVKPRLEYLCAVVSAIMGLPPTDPRVHRCVGSLQSQCLLAARPVLVAGKRLRLHLD